MATKNTRENTLAETAETTQCTEMRTDSCEIALTLTSMLPEKLSPLQGML